MLHTLYAEYILICQLINQSIWGTTDTQYRSCSLSIHLTDINIHVVVWEYAFPGLPFLWINFD